MNPELKPLLNRIRMQCAMKYLRGFLLIRPEKYALGIVPQNRDLKTLSSLLFCHCNLTQLLYLITEYEAAASCHPSDNFLEVQ